MVTRLDVDKIVSPFVDDASHGSQYFSHLKRKLRWQLLFVYVVPFLLLSVFFHYEYSQTLRQGIDTHLKSVAQNNRNTVSLFLQERVANVKSAFHFDTLPSPPSALEMKRVLDDMRKDSPTFVDLGLFNPEGVLIAYTGPFPHLLGKSYNQEEWFRTMLKQARDTYISDVYLGFRGKAHFIIAVRKEILGKTWVLRASVDPEKFALFISKSFMMKEVESFIVNKEGELQTPPNKKTTKNTISQIPSPSFDTQVFEGKEGNKSYLNAFAWLSENDWALVVRIPTKIAYTPMYKARLFLVGFCILTLVLIVVIILRSTNTIVTRLEKAVLAKEDLQQQLFNAAKLASVGEMAAGVAHEINNPLAIIYEEAGLMKDSIDPQFNQKFALADCKESLDVIMEATMRGRSITSKLLAFARKHEADPEPIDVNQFLEKVLKIKEHEFRVSNIEVDKNWAFDLPRVLVNENQMEQVFLNLLNNAEDAIDGPGKITLRTKLIDKTVQIDVEDTGCGIEEEKMEKIFFPFYTSKEVGKGTGLGLSISYGIIKALGGRIEVASEVGKGTIFSIILPTLKRDNQLHTKKIQG